MGKLFGLDDRLFQLDKTLRDPVHGDIMVTRLEVSVMDTLAFQRLRGIKQLGTADLVYPSAQHSRFEHSLGTLEMAERIVRAINANPKRVSKVPIPEEGRYFARLLALLHDIGHIPYGHTLEDETRVIDSKHDADSGRLKYFLELDNTDSIASKLGPELTDLLLQALTAKTDEDISRLRFPYAVDIVSNTVCADLLDYLKRDAYFTGLRQAYDDRFISYFMLVEPEQSEGVVRPTSAFDGRPALIIKKGDRVKWSVLSEVLKLLRLRYELGERVYFHHAKIVTSAMLSRAVQALGWQVEKIRDWSDDVLLHQIEHCKGKSDEADLARRLVGDLRRRRLYKPVYVVSHARAEANCALPTFEAFHESANARLAMENEFCKGLEVPEGSVIFYAPDPDMNLKEADVKVKWIDDEILPLGKIKEISKEKIDPIHEDHKNLWTFYVLIAPELFDEHALNLATLCHEEWGIRNEIASLSSHGVPLEFQALLQVAEECELDVATMKRIWDKNHSQAARGARVGSRRDRAYWKEEIELDNAGREVEPGGRLFTEG